MNSNQPLIRFEEDGTAPILSYDVPQPTSYAINSIIEFDYPADYFVEEVKQKPAQTIQEWVDTADVSMGDVEEMVREGVQKGFEVGPFETAPLFRAIDTRDRFIRANFVPYRRQETGPVSDGGTSSELERNDFIESIEKYDYLSADSQLARAETLDPAVIANQFMKGNYFTLSRTLYGDYVPNFVPEPDEPKPQLSLVERCGLSNYLGQYGAGRTIKTHTLFPGERSKIGIKTYENRERKQQDSSNVLEARTRESTLEFERTLLAEHSTKTSRTKQRDSTWNLGGGIEAVIPVKNVPVTTKLFGGGGGSRKVNSAREEIAKTVSTAVQKHTSSASDKREVEVNVTASFAETTGEEVSIEREIENINLSRTLNLAFRQMNQEFISLFHLTDVRLAFSNGYPDSYREVPLSRMDELLEEVLIEGGSGDVENVVEAVRDQILRQLTTVYDDRDVVHDDFVVRTERDEAEYNYWRVNREKVSTYEDDVTGIRIEVPGVILSASKNTLRTDGVIVEALLGHGEALDTYSKSLQTETTRENKLTNDLLESRVESDELARELVRGKDRESAEIFDLLFGEPPQEKTGDDQ